MLASRIIWLRGTRGSTSGGEVYGVAYTYAGGVDSSTSVGSGGVELVYGVSYYTNVSGGGFQVVSSGGLGYETYISSGGLQYVEF